MSAVKHLFNNFKELQKEPIVGANAMFHEDDPMKWYCIVMGPEGSLYEGVPIRFVLEFDTNYPNSPPKAFFDTYFAYYGGAQMKDDKGRIGVCLDIFGNFAMVHTEWKNSVGSGWSPSYTVSTILVNVQAMLSDFSHVSSRPEDISRTQESSFNYKCPITGHDGSNRSKWFPQVFITQEEVNAYKLENGIVSQPTTYSPLVDEYICYVTKRTKQDGALLGFGIHVENARIGMLSSPCEYLSKEAFDQGSRQSTFKKPFEYWLPVVAEQSDWTTVKPLFIQTVRDIQKALSFNGSLHINVIKVCASIMNSLVVEIMNSNNNVTANDKFINGYFALYYLLKLYSTDHIECLEYVDAQLYDFTTSVTNRNKSKVPNLGELLIYLTISHRCKWINIGKVFVEESDARNVFWYGVGNYNNRAKYPELMDVNVRTDRTIKVFNATETSRKLIMYQVEFSKVAKALTLEEMNSNFGLAPTDVRTRLKTIYNNINGVTDWNGYFNWLGAPSITDEVRCTQLINAVNLSNLQGYTGAQQKTNTSSGKKPTKRY